VRALRLSIAPVGLALALLTGCGGSRHPVATTTQAPPRVATTQSHRAAHRHQRSLRLVEHPTGSLAAPVQDAASAAIPRGRAMLLGGLTASDVSRADVVVAGSTGGRSAGVLPEAVHDTAAVRIGKSVYLFGGGTNSGKQSDAIVRVPVGGGPAAVVGRLPAPSSDQAAASIGGDAYVLGGYTGSRWLDTIVVWRPDTRARVVARLPFPLRYAAVAAAGPRLVIAGGSLESGSASDAVLEYVPGHGVVRLGRLPAPTTHAAAAALGPIVYVIGGRGAALGSLTRRIVAIDTARRRILPAGSLAAARSDLAAIGLRTRILLAGGRTAAGAVDDLSELRPTRATVPERSAGAARSARDVYAHDGPNRLTGAARFAKSLVYVPNSESDTVDVIDPATYRIVGHFTVGALPQHVVPAWDLKTLYVTNDAGNSLTPIDPRTGKPAGRAIPVEDPYNMYFTPNGRYAIVVAERLDRLDFRYAHTFRLHRSLHVPCAGVDHMDFTADGRYALASCEFSGQMVLVDIPREQVVRTIDLPDGRAGMPQDVKLSPDGATFYVADMHANGLWKIDARTDRVRGFLATGKQSHGLYPSRDARFLYVTNRGEGSISVVSFASGRQVAKWRIPGGGSPDMGGVSADGKVLWLSGRYNAEVYAISTGDGRLLARIKVGAGPHGVCVWPQPGRYSLGHTGILR
jgi:YVTN family beta-propeller protein